MGKWERIFRGLFFIGLQFYLDVTYFSPITDSFVQEGLVTLQDHPLVAFLYLALFNIIGIIGVFDLLSQIIEVFKS